MLIIVLDTSLPTKMESHPIILLMHTYLHLVAEGNPSEDS